MHDTIVVVVVVVIVLDDLLNQKVSVLTRTFEAIRSTVKQDLQNSKDCSWIFGLLAYLKVKPTYQHIELACKIVFMGHSRPLFAFIFVFSKQLTVNVQYIFVDDWIRTDWIRIGSDRGI